MTVHGASSFRASAEPEQQSARARIGVVIPCYRVTNTALDVIARIGPSIEKIYCVDDACPDGSDEHIEQHCDDPRVVVIRNPENLGVGGATLAGMKQARDDGMQIAVKIDGDGQMDPALVGCFVEPILNGRADYTKGNRFYHPSSVQGMPILRIFGNGVLSFLTKLSSGYWNIFDPTNGYVAIHTAILDRLPLEKISKGYFFESDMLFSLNIIRAVVEDVPMDAVYGDEKTNLVVRKIWFEFLVKNTRNFFKRIIYNYYLRNFTIGSVQLVTGLGMFGFGTVFGIRKWLLSNATQAPVTAGTVMLAALPVLIGFQLILSFFDGDTRDVPTLALHKRLAPGEPD